MSLLDALSPYKYVVDAALIAALAGGGGLAVHKYNAHQQGIGEARVQAKGDAVEKVRTDALAKEAADGLKRQQALQDLDDSERKAKNDQIKALNSANTALLVELHSRPSRSDPASLSAHPGAGPDARGTGAGLYREDGGFLAGEAARAGKLRADLIECQHNYHNAEKALN